MAKYLFLLAGIVLALTGVLHLVDQFATPIDMNAIVPVVVIGLLALAYLAIAILLLLRKESILMAGIIVPIVGLVLALTLSASSAMLGLFVVLDIIAAALCAYLYSQSRITIHRVR